MRNPLGRREMLKLAGAGLLGAAASRALRTNDTLTARAADVLVVKGGTLHDVHKSLGNWLFLAPTKLGGGAHAVDLGTGKTLAWIAYWTYGDTCPIAHHLAAYINVGDADAQRVRRDQDPFEEQMRVEKDQLAILAGARLRLVAVDDQEDFAGVLRDEEPDELVVFLNELKRELKA